eukprot:CAMPEP_0202691836 /NCGR_PEP_ID=MMETSP1385-20130828/6427_1 /ASSEMBLY_ACC=CAM_ASM_000861 /TAXON_ID=933848 /ORGANISM="Elphidium margaritaceum" /LENGTH=444 /DNA_ID=CAMNT_0049347291 /DNA_START=69 /DNA_END=1403 /DNA_ORIENTATION=+
MAKQNPAKASPAHNHPMRGSVGILQSDTLSIQAGCFGVSEPTSSEECKLNDVTVSAITPVASTITPTPDFDDDPYLLTTPDITDKQTLNEHGYEKGSDMCSQMQGQIFDCYREENGVRKRFAVKKVWKKLCESGIACEDGMNFIVESDIVKEAFILNLLTVKNELPADYIVRFVDLFEDDNATYLVTECGGDQTLKQFVDAAHEYRKNGTLGANEWRKTVKYVMWQLSVIVIWMHRDMHCCHLDLSMENIRVKNGTFIANKSADAVTINPKLTVQIADLGSAEVFNVETNANFQCGKAGMTGNYQYSAPQVYNNMVYDARKADVYQLGCILFHLSFFAPMYRYQESAIDASFQCIQRNDVMSLIEMRNLQKLASKKLIALLCSMVNTKEKNRASVDDIMQHSYFAAYYRKYAPRLDKVSEKQKTKNEQNKQIMQKFPFYSINYG